MITLSLVRTDVTADGVFGRLGIPGSVLFTCEDDWRDNLPGRSCIPAGTYLLKRGHFPTHGDAWEVTGVPGRSAILIHAGNTEEDTEGCILVGLARGHLPKVQDEDSGLRNVTKEAVLQSKGALDRFMTALHGETMATLDITWSAGLPPAPLQEAA